MLQTVKRMVANSCSSFTLVIRALPIAWTGCLVVAVLLYRHPGGGEGWSGVSAHKNGTQGTWNEATLSPLYYSVIAGLDSGQLARVVF